MKTVLLFSLPLVLAFAGCTNSAPPAPQPAAGLETPAKLQSLKARALVILEAALNSDNAYLRSHAIEVVAETRQKQMLPLVVKLTTDRSVAVRFAAATGLGDMQCFSCENVLTRMLNDPDMNVQIGAAYALAKMNQLKYRELIRTAAVSTDPTVRANAVLLLGKLGNRDDLALLYEVLNNNESTDKVRMQAVESIARLGDERMYRSKLWALLISKFADDRVMGIRGMGALNTPESRGAIVTMLQDDVPEVRLTAAEQLARLGDKRGETQVYEYFQTQPDLNKMDMANGMAVRAIGYLASSRLNSLLPQIIETPSRDLQLIAAQAVLLQAK
ncbi:MAG TPA: HEAT repeat domain-containing protein [Anaerohalosphaeraceae bacterium]|nr:HEAT repeat domain-containing protein [Phycisphaerae bacterium]HOL31817.1 HEAT repeat domain-containing protein [Anaerohalosphaeraceae bacterium]HOM75485.1 HEAT repeat domain-containing protein [Anaerohalosphaeraceae bacterium]HPC63787.1 HEAT repeat domain-containing protein [Anaerohalosphaeraceae bacterium]HPO70677.1 HEAT repeat domain-containing protein [Anaerohalosphaeraceae bacterium]